MHVAILCHPRLSLAALITAGFRCCAKQLGPGPAGKGRRFRSIPLTLRDPGGVGSSGRAQVSESPTLDFAFTVRDNAAGEVCPVWPGQPMTTHWGVPDPVAVAGTDVQKPKAFMDAAITLKCRIGLTLALALTSLAGMSLQREIDEIGKAGA